MADTAEVLDSLDWEGSSTRLLAIVANERGAHDALRFSAIDYLGYPFSCLRLFSSAIPKKVHGGVYGASQ